MQASDAREIEAAVGEALRLHGVGGQVVVRGRQLELHGHGAPVSIDLEQLPEQWELLPLDMRARKVSEVARRLAQAHHAVGGAGAAGGAARAGRSPRLIVVPAGAVLVVAIVVLLVIQRWPASTPPPSTTKPVLSETPDEAAARRARVCEAARKRIYAGASMGAFDTEGWVAELWLAWPGERAGAAALDALISGGRITEQADAELAALPDGQAEIVPGFTGEEQARFAGWQAATIRFSAGYVVAFLDPGHRARFVSMADRLADAAAADVGALYGRCAHLTYRDLGAWYRGADAPLAAAALVYAAGVHSELPSVDRKALAALPGPNPIAALGTAGAKLDAASLSSLVGADGGSVTGGPKGVVSLTFPLGGPTRASRASRIVAQKLGVGVGGE